ncbi:sporulation protein, YlmC/YmxH family [Caminicella sporogenes DSM 14501]|uniref:Sporulation protein, YlmC/YmxH family n=1 Tax=Caminicella sporogenes DSM 14501 TaxID=1121266 RepID=A0A1M6L795_9FIRM|nr:YlmC/YmxH family sporulation protein [Caminicella sporogenes]RKD27732.1 YlmC/YmxH family sporulation protein [Caminicella sporogenes]WIF94690.1 YlmC/YmxH family sporulation protein [Caminicella sporogenes]SHJ67075.1 sporulation protein, YlmC/YmxH family [Caminicella sporogenes DSM 14501]
MRFSELAGKEVVNLSDGCRLGMLSDSDLLIDEKTGKIKALLVPDIKSHFSFFNDKDFIEIPWDCVKKIGSDMIIIEIENSSENNFYL